MKAIGKIIIVISTAETRNKEEKSMFTIISKCLVISYRKEKKWTEVKRRGVERSEYKWKEEEWRGEEKREITLVDTYYCSILIEMQRFACRAWLWYEGHVDVVCFYDKNIMLLTTLIWGLHKIWRDDESHLW